MKQYQDLPRMKSLTVLCLSIFFGVMCVYFATTTRFPPSVDPSPDLCSAIKNLHRGTVNVVSFSPNGRFIACGSIDKLISVWEVGTAQKLFEQRVTSGAKFCLAFSPDSSRLTFTSTPWEVTICDVPSGAKRKTFKAPDQIHSLAYSPDGKLLVTGLGSNAILWDSDTGKQLRGFPELLAKEEPKFDASNVYDIPRMLAHIDAQSRRDWRTEKYAFVNAAAFSPDSRLLATGHKEKSEEGEIRIWDVNSTKVVAVLGHDQSSIKTLAFNPRGDLLVTGSADNVLALWDTKTWKLKKVLSNSRAPEIMPGGLALTHFAVECARFSPDGKRLATAHHDTADNVLARLWDVDSGREASHFIGDRREKRFVAESIDFSPDGRFLIVSGAEFVVLLKLTDGAFEVLAENHSSSALGVAGNRITSTSPGDLIEAALGLSKDMDNHSLNDVIKLLLVGNRYESATQIVKLITDHTDFDGAWACITESYARAELLDQAVRNVMMMRNKDTRDRYLKAIVEKCAVRDLPDLAEYAATQIEGEYERADAFAYVAQIYASVGQGGKAYDIAIRLPPYKKSEALREVAVRLARRNDFQASLRAARTIENPYYRARALSSIAQAMEKAGQREAARSTLADARSDTDRVEGSDQISTLCVVAIGRAALGLKPNAEEDLAIATHTVKQMERGPKMLYLEDIAATYATIGSEMNARKILNQMSFSDEREHALVLARVAKATAVAGNLTMARELLRKASELLSGSTHALQGSALEAIAREQSLLGDWEGTLETARRFKWDHERDQTLQRLICERIQTNRFDGLVKLASEISSEIDRNHALMKVARVLVKENADPNLIGDSIRLAHDSAVGIRRPFFKAKAFARIAEVEQAIGDLQNASATISMALSFGNDKSEYEFAGPEGHVENLALIAHVQDTMGQKAEANETLINAIRIIEKMESEVQRSRAMIKVANITEGLSLDDPCRGDSLKLYDEFSPIRDFQ